MATPLTASALRAANTAQQQLSDPQLDLSRLSLNVTSPEKPSLKPALLPFNVTPPKAAGPSEAERKMEALTKQIEEQMEQQEKSEYFGKQKKMQM